MFRLFQWRLSVPCMFAPQAATRLACPLFRSWRSVFLPFRKVPCSSSMEQYRFITQFPNPRHRLFQKDEQGLWRKRMGLTREQLRGGIVLVYSNNSLRENLKPVMEFKSLFPHSHKVTSCHYNKRYKIRSALYHPIPLIYYCLSILTHVSQWSLLSGFTTKRLYVFLTSITCVSSALI